MYDGFDPVGIGDPPEIEVLLATYNGARFLRQQIDSILEQDYSRFRVLARDDGSCDETPVILGEYAEAHPARFVVMPSGAPSGSPKGNFLRLMRASTARYASFADQDDIWLPDKLRKSKDAMDRLEVQWTAQYPLLVFTDLKVVDDALNTLHESFWGRMGIDPGRIDRLPELLVQSVVTGCTTLFNRPLLQLALRMPEEARLHDRWIALLASTLGKSSVVRSPTVLYRQHDRNAVGLGITGRRSRSAPGNCVAAATRANQKSRSDPSVGPVESTGQAQSKESLFNGLTRPVRLSDHAAQWEVSQEQAQAFLRVHGAELSADDRAVLNAYLKCQTSNSFIIRIATLLRHRFFYKGLTPNLLTLLYLLTTKAAKRDPGEI